MTTEAATPTVKKGLFAPAKMEQAYAKVGIYGAPGSGKTHTALLIALGLHKYIKSAKPIFFIETESGVDFHVARIKAAGAEVNVLKTRAFMDLVPAVQEAERNGSILIIDSITHFWQDVVDSYRKAKGRDLVFADWNPIKASFRKFTDLYVNSKLHIVMAGRSSETFEFFTDDAGKKQLEKTGTKMQAEKNLGYEPSLGLEMEKVHKDGTFKKGERSYVNRCYVLKDRFDLLDGQIIDNPTFESFLPHFKNLNLGGDHVGVNTERDSSGIFADKDHTLNVSEQMRQRGITIEELEGAFLAAGLGSSVADKKLKVDLLQKYYGTTSWEALRDLPGNKLKEGLALIRQELSKPAATNTEPITKAEAKALSDALKESGKTGDDFKNYLEAKGIKGVEGITKAQYFDVLAFCQMKKA
jgi:hypothetical protein